MNKKDKVLNVASKLVPDNLKAGLWCGFLAPADVLLLDAAGFKVKDEWRLVDAKRRVEEGISVPGWVYVTPPAGFNGKSSKKSKALKGANRRTR